MSYLFRVNFMLMNCILTWSCNPGQSEINGSCVDCSSNCISCTNNYTCDVCQPSFYKVLTQCLVCQLRCQACNLVTCMSYPPTFKQRSCSTCFPKFYISGINCSACPDYNEQIIHRNRKQIIGLQCAIMTSFTILKILKNMSQQAGFNLYTQYVKPVWITICLLEILAQSVMLPARLVKILVVLVHHAMLANTFEIHSVFHVHPHVMNVSTTLLVALPALTPIKQQSIFNVFALTDIILMDQINAKLCTAPCTKCKYNANNCKECIFTFTLSQSIQYQCDCCPGYFSVDSQKCSYCNFIQSILQFINRYSYSFGRIYRFDKYKFDC